MAIKKGSIESEGYNVLPVIPGNQKVWFLNGDLVRVYHLNKSNGIMSVYNITKDQIESCLISDFKKNRERAYTVRETADLVNRHKKYMPSLMKRGVIPFPTGSQKGGARGFQVRSYYSESQVREIRDILATYHIGRPRKEMMMDIKNLMKSSENFKGKIDYLFKYCKLFNWIFRGRTKRQGRTVYA